MQYQMRLCRRKVPLKKKIEHMKPDHITIFTVTVVVASCCNFLNTHISGTRYDMNPPINLQVVLIL